MIAARAAGRCDARGRVTLNAVRVARPDAPPNGFADRFAPRWYYKSAAYDVADREIHATTGARSPTARYPSHRSR